MKNVTTFDNQNAIYGETEVSELTMLDQQVEADYEEEYDTDFDFEM